MTHNEWEHGGRLTVNNATREQLKFMIGDKDSTIEKQRKEIEDKQKIIDTLCITFGGSLSDMEKSVKKLMRDNEENYMYNETECDDYYTHGYHDALVDVLKFVLKVGTDEDYKIG